MGFNVVNDMFAQNSWYFRNALVRANYNNLQKGITETTVYLERFFRSMLLGEGYSFRNRELHIEWNGDTEADTVQSANGTVQSANSALYLPPKGQNYTLEEVAVLRVVQMKPTATQKEIVAELMHGDYFFIPSYQRGFLVGFSLKIRNFALINRIFTLQCLDIIEFFFFSS